jgi:hypothetical protein
MHDASIQEVRAGRVFFFAYSTRLLQANHSYADEPSLFCVNRASSLAGRIFQQASASEFPPTGPRSISMQGG